MPDPQQPEPRRTDTGADRARRAEQLVAEQGVNDTGDHPGPVPPEQQSTEERTAPE